MILSRLEDDLNIIQTLSDTPTENATELKEKFDESGNTIKKFINETLIKEIEDLMIETEKKATLKAHPIGSYYWSSESTEPSLLFGGNWERIKDKFLYALGDSGKVGDVGGSSTHYHTQASNTGSTTLTVDQIPSHQHYINAHINRLEATSFYLPQGNGGFTDRILINTTNGQQTTANGGSQGHTHSLGSTNSASSIPPHIKAYCWKRIS